MLCLNPNCNRKRRNGSACCSMCFQNGGRYHTRFCNERWEKENMKVKISEGGWSEEHELHNLDSWSMEIHFAGHLWRINSAERNPGRQLEVMVVPQGGASMKEITVRPTASNVIVLEASDHQ